MPRTTRAAALVSAAVLTMLLGGCGQEDPSGAPVADVQVHDTDGMHGAVLPEPYDVPPVALTATDGSTYRLDQDPQDPLTLVFFGYTHCPDICQIVMADITSALNRLDDAQRQQVSMQFVTTDPQRDDPETLRAYLDRFDPEFGGLTGPLAKVVALGKPLGVHVSHGEKLPSGGYAVNHGTHVLGVRPDGTVPILWTEGTAPAKIADDIRTILREGIPQ
ncbi:MAG TPA: SCO family protein [Nocardioidaceae bacterium]|nr:SCO family protein [Nocardioidaceae bacterium]